jgi:hypothetical protein
VPGFELFYVSEAEVDASEADWYEPGWYYRRRLRYSEAVGPFETKEAAILAVRQKARV